MNKYHLNHGLSLLIISAICIFLIVPISAKGFEDTSEKSFEIKPGGNLMLDADFGSISINSWNQDKIQVTVTKKAERYSQDEADELFSQYRVSYKKISNGLEVRGEFPDNVRHRRFSVHFEILVPDEFNLDIETSGGSISVKDLKGDVELNTSGGSLKLGNIVGNIDARTSGGSISLDDADGEVNLKTSGGSISIGKTSGRINAKTSGGSIRLEGSGGDVSAHTSGGSLKLKNVKGNIDASTSGGSIRAELAEQIDKRCQLITSGGSIKVYLDPDISLDIDAATSAGRVSCELPITVVSLKKSNKLKGKINDGGPLLKLRTSGGNIKIMEL